MEGWGEDDEEEVTTAAPEPFIFESHDDSSRVQVLVLVHERKQVILPHEGKKGGCSDWVLDKVKKNDVELNFIKSQSGNPKAKTVYIHKLLGTGFATDWDSSTTSELTRCGACHVNDINSLVSSSVLIIYTVSQFIFWVRV